MDVMNFNMNWEQIISLISIALAGAGGYWQLRITITKQTQFAEMKLAELQKDIIQIKADLENHKDDNKAEFNIFIEQNREDHKYMREQLSTITNHLISK